MPRYVLYRKKKKKKVEVKEGAFSWYIEHHKPDSGVL